MRKFFLGLSFVLVSLLVSCANAKTPTEVKNITQAQFKTLVGDYSRGLNSLKQVNKKPVVVDIYATWCGPCKRLSPILNELATEYNGKVDFYKIDLDKNRGLGNAFGVQSIPMVIFIPVNGQPQTVMGLYPKAELKEVIDYMFFPKK